MRTERKRDRAARWRRGSFTVEAAVVAPLAVFITAALVSLCFFVHDRMWFTGAACEAVLAGNAGEDGREEAIRRAARRQEEQVIPGGAIEVAVEEKGDRLRVCFAGGRTAGLPWQLPGWVAEVEASRVHPAGYLRTWWAAKRLGKEVTGEG